MKYLIIPDVHNRISLVEKIIESVKPDTTIFLGDFFDDFYDTPTIIKDVAKWFKWSVNQKNRIHIQGNHDTHYWFKTNSEVRCSGYEYSKSIVINDIVTKEDWEKLKFFHILDDTFLLSHAGVHPSWIVGENKFKPGKVTDGISLKKLKSKLNRESKNTIEKLYNGERCWLTGAGYSRGGSQSYGGITWCDWTEEFHPLRGIHQIVGHTPCRDVYWNVVGENDGWMKKVRMSEVCKSDLNDKNSYNVCLDTHPGSQFYAIYDDERLKLCRTEDIK